MRRFISKVSIAVFLALVLFLVSTFALPVASAQGASNPECWAVFVGISNYQSINDLTYCDDDARDLSNVFSTVWGASHISLLIDHQATKAAILDAIDWLAANADTGDTVLFSYSGHGASTGYMCPYDTLSGFSTTMISTTELANAFQSVQAEKTVVILDMCYAGKFQSPLAENGRVILMASRYNEVSWEFGDLRNGLFSYYVAYALNNFAETDTNGDYELSAEEVAQYANSETTQYESSQHPVLDDGYSGQLALLAQFVFGINMDLPANTTVITIDGKNYTTAPSSLFWVPGVSHTITVPELVDKGTGTRYVFTQWSDGSVTVTRIVTKGSYSVYYDKEQFLEVISAFGETQGDGTWADFSVTEYIELPDTRHYFDGWSGDYSGVTPATSILMDDPKIVTAIWRHEYLFTLNSAYGTPTGAGWYKEGELASFSVTSYIELSDTKHYFTGWSGDFTGTASAASLTMSEPKVVNASWRHEYLLTLNSEYGKPTGAGWYNEGETASVSVEPVQGVIIRHIFDGWSGDLTDTDADSSVLMGSPRVVMANWRTDFAQLYMLVGGVVVVAGAIISTVVMVRKRKRPV